MLARPVYFLAAVAISTPALAQPVAHPVWAVTPGAEWDEPARAQFGAALAKRGLGAPETVAIPPPPTTPAADFLAQGMAALRAAAFDKAARLLSEAATRALATGGAGLGPGQAASLFFHQAMAVQLASGATYSEPFTEIAPPEAKTAYLRAAALGGGASLDAAADQPLTEASWQMAKSLVASRPQVGLTVRTRARAKVAIDGKDFQPSPATVSGLAAGEHFVLVEEPGHLPWSTTLNLAVGESSIDVPGTPLLVLDAATAATLAQARGAAFALVGQLHLGDKVEIDLRLVDAASGALRASTAVALAAKTDSPDLAAAVLRLDEMASRTSLARRSAGADGKPRIPLSLAPPPARAAPEGAPEISQDTPGWLRQHWPLATAVGAALGTTIALGIVVAKDRR